MVSGGSPIQHSEKKSRLVAPSWKLLPSQELLPPRTKGNLELFPILPACLSPEILPFQLNIWSSRAGLLPFLFLLLVYFVSGLHRVGVWFLWKGGSGEGNLTKKTAHLGENLVSLTSTIPLLHPYYFFLIIPFKSKMSWERFNWINQVDFTPRLHISAKDK